MNILSVQSHVTYGYVGNSAAVFALQRLGHQVWPIHTVAFSNHTGYEGWSGQVFTADHVRDLVDGLEARGLLRHCDAVLTGYLGSLELAHAILDAVDKVRTANPDAVFACDPVMGDRDGGLYVRAGLPEFFAERAIAAANIISPNHFELEQLAGEQIVSRSQAISAASRILSAPASQSLKAVVITSLAHEDVQSGEIEMLAVSREGTWQLTTPFLAMDPMPSGAGDLVSALFLAHSLSGNDPATALAQTGSSVFAVLSETQKTGSRELELVRAQDKLASPDRRFKAIQIT
ncbi:MAG: pyridoxal kinase PdxY [Pseudomonadota bacterium]